MSFPESSEVPRHGFSISRAAKWKDVLQNHTEHIVLGKASGLVGGVWRDTPGPVLLPREWPRSRMLRQTRTHPNSSAATEHAPQPEAFVSQIK